MLVADVDAARGAQLDVPAWGWIAFLAFLAALLLVDLLILHRKAEVISLRRAAIESAGWITIGLAFGLFVAVVFGSDAAGEYYAGYLIEKSLSVDNVFVWALILVYFAVPRIYQHRVLFWGIFAALVLRAIFIFGGVALLDRLDWLMYLFGGFLIFTAVRLLVSDPGEIDPSRSRILTFARRIVPSTDHYDGQKLFTREMGRRVATPLFFVLIVIEVSDLLFAVDSVPAILAVTRDQFIVFTSNALAIVGLRSLYFLLADLEGRFRFLQPALAVVLAFVGVKMLLAKGLPAAWVSSSTPSWLSGVHIPTVWSLLVIAVILVVGIVASVRWPGAHPIEPPEQEAEDAAPATGPPAADRYSRRVLGELVDIVDERRRFVRPPGRPFVVGITGSVAVGKSHLALELAHAVEGLGGSPTASLVETDAFLRPNRDLDEAGLSMREGFPESFEAPALVDALQQLREGKGALVPVYSHLTYDIVADQTREIPARDLVIVAGLHLGLFARDEIDLLIHLEAAEDDLETWYLERFRLLYREAVEDPTSFYRSMVPLGEEGAVAIGEQAWTDINLVNLREHVDPARPLADVVVLKGSDHSIVAITRQSGAWMKGW